MKLPVLGLNIDERFLMHRLRSTSIGGLAAVLLTAILFFNDLFGKHVTRWDLFSIIATAAFVKIAVLIFYRLTD
jgi:hypothetical protein